MKEKRIARQATKKTLLLLAALAFFFSNSCLPKPIEHRAKIALTLYGFSIMKEALEKEIYPAFVAKWKQEHGEEASFTSSFAGSETVTNQILQGAPADIAILSIERDVERLATNGAVTSNWKAALHGSIVNKTPFVILVRQGNPKGIKDFPDLAKPGVKLIHPDPVSSGGAQWSILAIYGSELKKSERTGQMDTVRALQTLQAIWKNVISTPGSAREARTQFELGQGDALITYELEGLLMKQAGAPIDIIVPQSTIFSEHPAVIVDRNATGEKRKIAEAFLQYLWTEEAQKAFVKYHFRSVTDEKLNEANPEFARIEMPFDVSLFGGWQQAYPEIIEGVFKNKVQQKR